MTRQDSNIVREFQISPLFYDALSGEFTPKGDTRKRTQTLGRLALATIQRGTYSVDDFCGESIPMFTLPLSWAKGLICRVDGGLPDDGSESNPRLYGVMLNDETDPDRQLYITNPFPGDLDIGTVKEDLGYTLRLGRGIENARAAVTAATRDFFNNTTYPINSRQK